MSVEHINERMRKGQQLLKQKSYPRAIEVYQDLVQEYPNDPHCLFALGNSLLQVGKLSLAQKQFERALEVDANHTDAAIALSVIYNDTGQYDKGREIFQRAMKNVKKYNQLGGLVGNNDPYINKKFSLKHFELGDMYFSHERYEEAMNEFHRAIKLNPENLNIQIKLAKTYAKKGLVAKAFQELKRLKNENPDFIPARMAIGLLYFSIGKVLEAQNEWQNILSISPQNVEAIKYLQLSNQAKEVTV